MSYRAACKKELARRVYAQQIDESSKSVFEAIEETLKTERLCGGSVLLGKKTSPY